MTAARPDTALTADHDPGVVLRPDSGGRVSSTAIGQAVVEAAARASDPVVADRIAAISDWRHHYVDAYRALITAAAADPTAAADMSRTGAQALIARSGFRRDGEFIGLDDAMALHRAEHYRTLTIRGHASAERDLSVPYRGRRLFGGDLRDQVHRWVDAGIAEPSFATAIEAVMAHPEWLDLSDVEVAVIGAAAEMAPTRFLLRWGARVHAVDLPNPTAWSRLIQTTRATAGRLSCPIEPDRMPATLDEGQVVGAEMDTIVAQVAGADLLARAPEVRAWFDRIAGPLVIGNYTYADSVTHVRLSLAADAVMRHLVADHPDSTLAYLATPTDQFMVPLAAVEESRRRWSTRGFRRLTQAPLRLARQFEPNYASTIITTTGREVGVNDSMVVQQGPNYALAKRFQRWQAVTMRACGVRVSLNIAPATRTVSVVKNRALSAAYAGAGRFGVEVFEPGTSTALMAAMLVHDLRNPASTANPSVPLEHPLELFIDGANHGGLWRMAYSPRSVLGMAAVLGMFESRA